MGKRINYRNVKLMELPDDFDFDSTKIQDERIKYDSILQGLYDGYEIEVPKEDSVINVIYVGTTSEYLTFEGKFKDYVRVDNKPNEAKYLKNTNIGDKIDLIITEVDEENFFIKGSISALYESRAHATLKKIEEGQSVTVLVKEMTPAGYNVDIQYEGVTLSGFMPNTLAGINKLYNPESLLNQLLEVMIESFSRDEGTYIVSRRRYLQTLIPQAIKELKTGIVYSGHVTGSTQFGVFIEFNNCLTGMIHKTNLNPEWQEKISQITPGYKIDFYIKEIIKDKIILTQILRNSIWDTIKSNQVLTGKVRDTKQFGVLISLDDDCVGLVHTSEVEKANRSFINGDTIKVKVISVDRPARKIFLTVA